MCMAAWGRYADLLSEVKDIFEARTPTSAPQTPPKPTQKDVTVSEKAGGPTELKEPDSQRFQDH